MARLRTARSPPRARLAHAVLAVSLVLVATCDRTPTCPPRDRAELVETIDTSKSPRPAALALAEAWVADAGVERSIAPRLALVVTEQSSSFPFWELLLRVAPAYTEVADALATRGLPVALAAIPLGLTRYGDSAVRADCRAGPWLLQPTDPGVRAARCKLRDSPTLWSPPGEPEGGLLIEGVCRIADCETDERTDLTASTRAAMSNIEARWQTLPADDDRLATVAAELSGEDPALVLARHLLATCFYADGAAAWSARWKPAPRWCADVLPYPAREVAACAGVPDPPPTY